MIAYLTAILNLIILIGCMPVSGSRDLANDI
jgi:hypothetical protein